MNVDMSKPWAVVIKGSNEVVSTWDSRSQARGVVSDANKDGPSGLTVRKTSELVSESNTTVEAENTTSVVVRPPESSEVSVETSNEEVEEEPVQKKSRAPRTGTKKEQATAIVREVYKSGGGRKEALAALMDQLGMSKAGANTYLYLVKAEATKD